MPYKRVETPIPVGDEDAPSANGGSSVRDALLRLPSPSVTRTHDAEGTHTPLL